MKTEELKIGQRHCLLMADEQPEMLLVQPVGSGATDYVPVLAQLISSSSAHQYALLAFTVDDWEAELAPWPEPLLFKNAPAETLTSRTLEDVETHLLPYLNHRFGMLPVILGGYSLGGLFALWASYYSSAFAAIAAVSPSVWLADWIDFAQSHRPQTKNIYLSQGDQEAKTRHPDFARGADNIRQYHQLLCNQIGETHCTLQWNKGNHFVDTDLRTAKGFVWCMNQLKNKLL